MMVVFCTQKYTHVVTHQTNEKKNFSSLVFDVVLLQLYEKIGKRFQNEVDYEEACKASVYLHSFG